MLSSAFIPADAILPLYNPVMHPALSLPPLEDSQLESLFAQAEEIGLLLELTDGGITWESAPGRKHQDIMLQVVNSIVPRGKAGDYECYKAFDLNIRLPDGLVKRPDISIFCKIPDEEEGFVHELPEAVVEITSPWYEAKDLVTGPPIYLRNKVRDVLVLDRASNKVHHWTASSHRVVPSPTSFELVCGCSVTV